MAKSMLNGVNPDDVIRQYGADTLRLYEMFMGEFELPKPWDSRAIEGCNRFLRRVWRLVDEFDPTAPLRSGDPHLRRLRHRTIKQVQFDLDRMQFNTAVARLMEYVNELTAKGPTAEDLDILIKLLGPFAPHLCDEAWERMGGKGFLVDQPWPAFDESLTVNEMQTIVVQINGKLRGEFQAVPGTVQDDLQKTALSLDKIKPHLEGKNVRKVIVVPGKLVNIVAG
jgi:leucyl-tRNA synthetase